MSVILLLAIATSIDALAAGISLPMLHQPLLPSILIIGVTAAVLSASGLFAGRRFGAMLGACKWRDKMHLKRMNPTVLVLILLLRLTPALAREYDVNLQTRRDVRFHSETAVNSFEGVTEHIDGYVLLPDTTPPLGEDAKGSELHFEVELASLDTGIGLRNRHMRDNYLQVEKYPYAVFSGSIAQVESTGGDTLQVTAKGEMQIHGKKKQMSIPCTVNSEDSGYRVHGAFTVLLSDFDISIPKIMFLQLDNEIHLEVDFAVEPIKD